MGSIAQYNPEEGKVDLHEVEVYVRKHIDDLLWSYWTGGVSVRNGRVEIPGMVEEVSTAKSWDDAGHRIDSWAEDTFTLRVEGEEVVLTRSSLPGESRHASLDEAWRIIAGPRFHRGENRGLDLTRDLLRELGFRLAERVEPNGWGSQVGPTKVYSLHHRWGDDGAVAQTQFLGEIFRAVGVAAEVDFGEAGRLLAA